MPTNDDCPVCNGRKIIFTRDYADCEREEPCPQCSEHEHCASCIALRAENARLREAAREAQHVAKVFDFNDGCKAVDRILETALKEPGV